MSKGLPQLLTLSLLGAAIIVLIGIGLESVINSLDDMLEPCQHGTSYNKLTSSCDCKNTPFRGKYCGICDCQYGQCMVGGTTPKAGSLYGCRCPINTKRFGFKCDLCFTTNTESCDGPCANGFYGALCDKICIADLTQTELFAGETTSASTCKNIRDNGGTCNFCSGHGSCGATGDCECEKNYFNGPNGGCSQTCPVSTNGKICSGHGVCEKIAGVPSCACEYGWRGTDCSVPCPGVRETGNPCSGHGQCLVDYSGTPTTSCNCNQKFRGEACEKECPGEFVACTGHGQCDDNAQCTCDSPAGGITWVGEDCACSDFVTCNGNGNCNTNGECVCIGNWGGKHCRQCKENYYGSNCQHKCNADGEPSTDILGCYGRGTCTILDFGMSSERVVCECFGAKKKFDDGKITTVFSNYEPLDNCRDCAPGYVPKITAVDQYGLPDGITVPCELYCDSLTCNNLGECNEDFGIPNEPLCHCDHGPQNKKHLDDNNFCLTCETGWFPEDLHSPDGCSNFCTTDIGSAPYNGNFPSICATGVVDCKHCNGHGTCSGRGECLCEEGYTGVECNVQCTGADGLTCSGHGECKVNKLQELMQFEYQFLGNSGALYSCECEPQDPYTDEERKDFRVRVANGEINGTLEDPPVKTFYGEMCEYNCKSPPWANSEVCNGFGKCEINQVQDPNGGIVTCASEDDCTNNANLMSRLSGVADWSANKGPFCHKVDAPPGCTSSNFTNEDCFYILSLQRPTAARGKECMRDASCRTYMDNHDWYGWCNTIEAAQNPFTTCSSDHESYCPLINSGQSIDSSCAAHVNQLGDSTFSITDQLNYCYEKDKAKYPFKMTEAYRYKKAVDKHDEIAESFQNFAIKHPTVTMDASQYCTNYLAIFDIPVTHIRSDKLYICNNQIQHTDNCSTTVLALDTVWNPFYVDCDGQQTQYTTLEEAIDNRHEGCVVVEEVVEVENTTLQTLFNVKSQLGQQCVDNADCASTLCFEGTCCTAGTDTTNCEKCNSQGTCDCLPGANLNGDVQYIFDATSSSPPVMTESECKEYAESIGASWDINTNNPGPGCVRTSNYAHVRYNPYVNSKHCNANDVCVGSQIVNKTCIQKNKCPGTDGKWIENVGCVDASVGDSCTMNTNCKSGACIGGKCAKQESPNCAQVNAAGECTQCIADSGWKYFEQTSGAPSSFGVEVTSGVPDGSVSKAECQAYAESQGNTMQVNYGVDQPLGCGYYSTSQPFYWSPNGGDCGTNGTNCIQKSSTAANYVNLAECELYAHANNYPWGGYNSNLIPSGCVRDTVGVGQVRFGGPDSNGFPCGTNSRHCIQKNPHCIPNSFCTAEVSSGAPDGSMSEAECQAYGNSNSQYDPSTTYGGNFHGSNLPSGCYRSVGSSSSAIWYNTNVDTTIDCSTTKLCIQKPKNKWFVTDEGCVDKPSDALEQQVHTLLEKTCSNAESIFPVCQLPTDACNINGISACNDGDSCHIFEGDAICSTLGVLNATCKFALQAVPLSFSTYKCVGNFAVDDTCLEASRAMNWFSYCKDSNAVLFHDNFGVDAIQENEQPSIITLEEDQGGGDLLSFWVKTSSIFQSSATLLAKSGTDEIFRVFLHQGQIQLNGISTVESCPLDQPTCNDDFSHSINEWFNIKVSIAYASRSVTLHYNGKVKTDGFLCTICVKEVTSGAPASLYDEVTSGAPDLSVSEAECEAHRGSGWSSPTYTNGRPRGCYKAGGAIYYNHETTSIIDCSASVPCIQKSPTAAVYMHQADCEAYAGSVSYTFNTHSDLSVDPLGCFIKHGNNQVWYNSATSGGDCSSSKKCIQKRSGLSTINIEPGAADTYYDEIIFSKAIAAPSIQSQCSNFKYCDFDVDYRDKCIDLLTNVKYPRTVEPQLDVIDTCKLRKENKRYTSPISQVRSGLPDLSLSQEECQAYAEATAGLNWGGDQTWTGFSNGCVFDSYSNSLYFIANDRSNECGNQANIACLQKLGPAIKNEMDKLNWTTYCKFTEELEEDISCGTLTHTTLEDYPTKCDPWIAPVDTSKTCVLENLQHNWTQQCQTISEAFIPANMKTQCSEACYQHLVGYDQCPVRKTIFSSNIDIPFSVSGCNSVNWLNYCNEVAQNKHPGVCSAVECDCSSQAGMTGDSCGRFCNLASDGSPCGIDSGVGVCQYTHKQKEQLAVGPYPTEMIEIVGECQCFASEGTSNCDQQCAACVNTTYSYTNTPQTLYFGNSGSDHYVYDGENDTEITVCSNTPITFERSTTGHTLRVVSHADCTECYTGTWYSLPTTSVGGWTDANYNAPTTVTFTETGTYYYLCTAHPNMVGKINVRTCGGQIGICDASRGICQCLPPWTVEKHVEYETWKGDIRRKLERVYELPTSLLNVVQPYVEVTIGAPDLSVTEAECRHHAGDNWGAYQDPPNAQYSSDIHQSGCIQLSGGIYYNHNMNSTLDCTRDGKPCIQKGDSEVYDKAQEDIFRIRMMQGREAFTRYYLDTSTTEDTWKTTYQNFKLSPSSYQCANKPCDFHDVVLLGNLQESSFSYNYDCAKTCPAVDPNTKIPCSGHGRCAITGNCMCDPAKVIRGTDASTGSSFQINIFGGETLEQSEFMVSKLDQTGYRGEDCSLTCLGYHPERQDMTEVCSGHGVCNMDAECQCDLGYTGEICQFTCPGFQEGDFNVCSGHGTCGLSEVKIFSDIFDEFDETFRVPHTLHSQTRKTNEQRSCPLAASKSVALGYSIINDIDFLDLTKIFIMRESNLCSSATVQQCKRWKDYQNIYYVNRHPFTVSDYSLPSGCVLDGKTVMFNDRTTEVLCENGCVCEGVDVVPGVASIHDYQKNNVAYEPLTEWDGFQFKDGTNGYTFDTTSSSPPTMTEAQCHRYANSIGASWDINTANPGPGCVRTSNYNHVRYNPYVNSKHCNPNDVCVGEEYYPLTEYECYFYADKVLLQPYVEVQSGSPTQEVTRDECLRYTSEVFGVSMFEAVDDFLIPSGCLKKMASGVVDKIVYNTDENTVACSSTKRCVEKPYERISSTAKPSGCLKIGDNIKFNDAATSMGCTSSNICIEKEMKEVDPVVVYHKQIGFNYSENVGRYAGTIIAGPLTEANIINICDNDSNCGGYFALVPDTEGTYVAISKFGNSIVEDRAESYRLIGLQTECSGKTDLGTEFYEVDSGMPDDSATEADCERYKGSGFPSPTDSATRPSGCYKVSGSIYYNHQTSSVACGDGGALCINKRAKFFTTFSPANTAIDLNSCAEVCRVTNECRFFSVKNNVCYMHDGCDQFTTGTHDLYQMQPLDDGKVFKHMMKVPPTLCMTQNGANFDEKTQAPVIRSINFLKVNCTDNKIWSEFARECVDFSSKPYFSATFFLDKGTENEKQQQVECQITGNATARCGLCSCFSDYIYGKWAGFTCETCNVGFGNSQCRQKCPEFDGDNLQSMCGGKGACLFGSEENSDGERLFQHSNCVCGQSNQYADRQPSEEIISRYPDTGGIHNDGSLVGYYYFTPIPYFQTYVSRVDAQTKCSTFNDLDNIDRGGFCYGVYRKYISVTDTSSEVYLVMGFVGGSYTLYGKYWQKQAISGYSKFFDFQRLELYNAIEGLPTPKECKDILSIRSEGYDTCNHFASEDVDLSCNSCEEGWTGKNCRYVCSNCLLGGDCAGVPSDDTSSVCTCPTGAGALWEHQCCPTGFMVADKATWQGKSQSAVNSIRISLTYDSSTTNELDASYYCKTCPGVSHLDWMSPDALYKVCSGPSRGTCQTVAGKLELACNCKINPITKNRWLGRACACDESIDIAYSTDANKAESSDYGCLLPTNGNGICPTSSTENLFFNPPRIWARDATYIVGETYGSQFFGVFAGKTFATKTFCSYSSPCHTGEGPCQNDDECAGTLKCFIRNGGEEKMSFNSEKVAFDMNYCYHEAETMVGCHPADFENYLNTREYYKQFYYDAVDSSFKAPILGQYVPYTLDANRALVIHQQAFPCPVGRYGITVPGKVTYNLYETDQPCVGTASVRLYQDSTDNPGTLDTQARRCFEGCMNQRTPIGGTWIFQAKAFYVKDGGCWCQSKSNCNDVSFAPGHTFYNIQIENTWHVCEQCQPGKYQDQNNKIQIVKVRTRTPNTNSITKEECKEYADWFGYAWSGNDYSNSVEGYGCTEWRSSSGSKKLYFNNDETNKVGSDNMDQAGTCHGTRRSSGTYIYYNHCLQYGGGLGLPVEDKHPNCKNCPSGKFGGPLGSWSEDLCQVCEAGQETSADGLGCVDCAAGRYGLGGVCINCPSGQFSAVKHGGSVQQPCNNCPIGTDTNGQIATPGTDDSACTKCPAGKANGVEGAECINCAAGKFTADAGNGQCTLCGIQQFAPISGMTSCNTCGANEPYVGLYAHVDNRDTCGACTTGQIVSASSGECENCPLGKDQPLLTHQASCAICEAGRFGDVQGLSNCKYCATGQYNPYGYGSCKNCAVGQFGDVQGLSSCKNCAVGQFENREGSAGCSECPAGQYQDKEEQASCSECAVGRYGDVKGLSSCKNCRAGEYENREGSVGCPYCPAGQYQDKEEQASCKSAARCYIPVLCATGYQFKQYSKSGGVGCTGQTDRNYYCSNTDTCRFSDHSYKQVGSVLGQQRNTMVTYSQTAAESLQAYTDCYNYCYDTFSQVAYFQNLGVYCYCYASGTSSGYADRFTFKINC